MSHPPLHWGWGLGAACAVALSAFGSMVSTSGLAEAIRRDLALTYAQAGFLLSAPFPLVALSAFMGGSLVDRLGVGRMVSLGAALVLAGGGGRAWAGGFWGLAAGTALVGMGTGLIYPALPKIVSACVPPARQPLASSLYAASVIAGGGLAIGLSLFMAPLARWLPFPPGAEGWRGAYFGWALGVLAAGGWWLSAAGRLPRIGEKGEGMGGGSALYRSPAVWAVALSLFVNNVIFFTSLGWFPAILAGKGWTPSQAAGIVSLIPWLGVAAVFAAHPAAAGLGGERRAVALSSLLTALAIAPIGWGGAWLAAAGVALVGLAVNFWFLFCLAFPARFRPREQAGRAGGFIIGLGYTGGFVGPWAAGALKDWAGGFGPALCAMAALALAAALAAPFFGREEPGG
ncbi:MAG: MFS transporter [Nitrospinota bacterium]